MRRGHAMIAVLALGLMFGLTGLWKGTGMADEITQWRTLCIGRYLVDVPAELDLLEFYGSVNAVQIQPLGPGDAKDRDRLFDARIAELRDGRATSQGIGLIYKDHRTVGEVRIVAHRADTSALGTTFADWTEEAFVVSDGALFRLQGVIEPGTADTAQSELAQIAGAVQPRGETEVPRGVGTCVPGAFVAVRPMSEAAGATLGLITDDGALGLQVSFVQRAPHHLPLAVDTRLNIPAARDTEIAGYPGQQAMLDETYLNFGAMAGQASTPDTWGHMFRVEYYDQRSDRSQGPVTADQARALWPRVLQSIRQKG